MDSTTNPPSASGNTALVARGRTMLTQAMRMSDQPGVRRALPAIMLVGAAVMVLFAYLMFSQPNMKTLYPGMPEAEKALALDTLAGGGIAASLDPTTGDLTVSPGDYYRARMLLAGQGLPQGTPSGYDALSDMPMGTSRSVESARLRQMQELELARSISELQPVNAARVHLALPERTAFIRASEPPRASIFVQLVPGRALDEGQVRAIVSLVTTSVPNMTPSNVSVVDQTGRLLSGLSDDPSQMLTDQQMQHQLKMETLFRNRIESLITPIVGFGNAAVEVTLDMDFTRSEIMNEQFNPNGIAIRSEQTSAQNNTDTRAGGIPGSVANTPPQQPELTDTAADGAAESSVTGSSSTSSTRNYEVSRRVETVTPASAKVMKIHAAVLVHAPAGIEGESGAEGGLNAELLADIEKLTRTAIGFDEARGDTITVSSRAFVETFPEIKESWFDAPWISTAVRYGVQLAILGIVVLGIIRPILNRVLPQATTGGALGNSAFGAPIEVAEGDSLQDLQRRLNMPVDPGNVDGSEMYDTKVALLRQMAEQDTSRIANVFQTMMEGEKDMVK